MWEMSTMERRYSVPPSTVSDHREGRPGASEDLHAWSIYRQNLNSDFTDSALGSSEKSPLPYGNFQLRESTVQSILSHPRYGPKSELGSNMYTYLKFGLPRVFPPSRGPRDGSSGYDSSDDGSPYLHRRGRYLRSKSDPDFRTQAMHHGPPGQPRDAWWGRVKSSSEANLLSHEAYYRDEAARRSVHDLRPKVYPDVDPAHPRPRSKAGSHVSVTSRRSKTPTQLYARDTALLNDKYFPKDGFHPLIQADADGAILKHPHIQVRGLDLERYGRNSRRLLHGINFEVFGGEIMAIMSTSEEEGTGLLDVLADRHGSWGGKVRGEIILNGHPVRSAALRNRVAYVQQDSRFSPDMNVRQTLTFHTWLRSPGSPISKADTRGTIDALIEDLGLEQVRHTRVGSLTTSEKQRLNVACHLLLDTDILLLDQPTRGMDIFDTFFLVEFLRQWAARGRIIILTIHPPTYEIFTMVSQVALISTGRLMYCGRRRDMLPYFAFIEYPCPAYKNPSDYYLDLVTLDDLSAEAMLESSQRIEQLAETFRRRQEPLSEPGPPSSLPPKIRRANCFVQTFALWIRALIYMYPINLVQWVEHVMAAVILSVIMGAIFWDLQSNQPNQLGPSVQPDQYLLNDRLGYHYTMMVVALWPLLLQVISDVGHARWAVMRDVGDRLYSRFWYIMIKMMYSLPAYVGVAVAYIVPAYAMTGLHIQGNDDYAFYIYVGYMLLYIASMQMMSIALAHMVSSRHLAAILGGLLFTALALASGYVIHFKDLGIWCNWVKWISPTKWMIQPVVKREFQHITSLMCRNKQVQHQDIIVQLPCPITNGTSALVFMDYNEQFPLQTPLLATVIFWIVFLILACFFFLVCRYKSKPTRSNTNKP